MKIFEIVCEAEGDFERYRQLGRNPLKLIGQLAKSAPGVAASAVDKTTKLGKKLVGVPYDEPTASKKTAAGAKPVASSASRTVASPTVNVEKTKSVLDNVLKDKPASSEDIQHLMKLKNQIDDAQLQMTFDKIQRGSTLEFTDKRLLQNYRNRL